MIDFGLSPDEWYKLAGFHRSYDGLLRDSKTYPLQAQRDIARLVARLRKYEHQLVNYNLEYNKLWDSYIE